MYIVRWLMSHPIIATWVLGAIAILLTAGSGNKDEILEKNKSVDAQIESTNSEVVNKPKSEKEKVESSVKASTEKAVAPIKKPISNVDSQEAPPLKSVLDNPVAKKSLSTTAIPTVSNNAVDTKNSVNNGATADLGKVSTEEMLLMAREAYWNNGLDEAAQIYGKLIKLEPKILEHKGELGNVYWRQGFPKKAAELYSEIAIPMIDEGGSERVANMIGFIGLFYPDRAAEIHKKMQSKK